MAGHFCYQPLPSCPVQVCFPFMFLISCSNLANCCCTSESMFSIFLRFEQAQKLLLTLDCGCCFTLSFRLSFASAVKKQLNRRTLWKRYFIVNRRIGMNNFLQLEGKLTTKTDSANGMILQDCIKLFYVLTSVNFR